MEPTHSARIKTLKKNPHRRFSSEGSFHTIPSMSLVWNVLWLKLLIDLCSLGDTPLFYPNLVTRASETWKECSARCPHTNVGHFCYSKHTRDVPRPRSAVGLAQEEGQASPKEKRCHEEGSEDQCSCCCCGAVSSWIDSGELNQAHKEGPDSKDNRDIEESDTEWDTMNQLPHPLKIPLYHTEFSSL